MTKQTKAYLFQEFLILSLDKDWINLFKGIPTFDVFIDDDKRLHLVSKEVISLE